MPPLPEADLQIHITQLRHLILEQLQAQQLPADFAEPVIPNDFVGMHKVTNGIISAGVPSETAEYKLVEPLPSTGTDPSFDVWSNELNQVRLYFHSDGKYDNHQEIVAAFKLGGTLQELATYYAYCRALPMLDQVESAFADRPESKYSWRVLQAGIGSGGLGYQAVFEDLRAYIDAWSQRIEAMSGGTNNLPHFLSEW